MQKLEPVTLTEIESLLMKALTKIRKVNNPSEQNSGLGLVNRASNLGKSYTMQVQLAKAEAKFNKMQDHKLHLIRRTSGV